MQNHDPLKKISQLRAQLDDLRVQEQVDPDHLSSALSSASNELQTIERLLVEKGNIVKPLPFDAQDFLDKVINSFGDPIFVQDRQHRYVLVNSAECGFMGLQLEEIIGKTCYDLFPKEQADIFWEKDEEVFATGKENADEELVTDGRGVVRTNLIDYANAPIIVWDSSFRITRFNHAFERLTQKIAIEVLGKHLEILFPENSKARSLEYIKLTSSGERWEVVEIPILRADNSVRIVLWNSANIYDKDGTTILTTIAQGQDITERKYSEDAIKESERRLTDIIDFLPDATFVIDKEGRVIAWNRAIEAMTGIRAKDILGKETLSILCLSMARGGRF